MGPWPAWLTWLGIVLQTERPRVQFLLRANARVVGLVLSPSVYGRQLIDVSLSLFSLPSPLPKISMSLGEDKSKKKKIDPYINYDL